jgi:hypothetical protein
MLGLSMAEFAYLSKKRRRKKRFKRLCGAVEGKKLFANERKFDEFMEDLRKFDCQLRFDL